MYNKDSLMPWGKYKLQRIKEVPGEYLINLYKSKQLDKDPELKEYIEYNLDVLRGGYDKIINSLEIVHFICDKKTFPSKKDAQQSLKKIRSVGGKREKPMRAYECPKCSGWHLTSMPYETFKEMNLHRNEGVYK